MSSGVSMYMRTTCTWHDLICPFPSFSSTRGNNIPISSSGQSWHCLHSCIIVCIPHESRACFYRGQRMCDSAGHRLLSVYVSLASCSNATAIVVTSNTHIYTPLSSSPPTAGVLPAACVLISAVSWLTRSFDSRQSRMICALSDDDL